MRKIISKQFQIDIAHIVTTQNLPLNFRCKCRNVHGHTVTIVPEICGNVNSTTRMVIDYTCLNKFKDVLNVLDHSIILPDKSDLDFPTFEAPEFIYVYDWKTELAKKTFTFVPIRRHGSVTRVHRPSTTSEDMTVLLTLILGDTIESYRKTYPYIEENLTYNLAFKETPKSNCTLSRFYSFKELVDIISRENDSKN